MNHDDFLSNARRTVYNIHYFCTHTVLKQAIMISVHEFAHTFISLCNQLPDQIMS